MLIEADRRARAFEPAAAEVHHENLTGPYAIGLLERVERTSVFVRQDAHEVRRRVAGCRRYVAGSRVSESESEP